MPVFITFIRHKICFIIPWWRHQMEHFLCYWPFEWGINRSIVDSPHKGQWRRALMFSVMFAWPNEWTNNRNASDLRRHHSHYDVTVMHWFWIVLICKTPIPCCSCWNESKFKTTSQWFQKMWYCCFIPIFLVLVLMIGANCFYIIPMLIKTCIIHKNFM